MVFVVSPMHMNDLAMDRKETRCYVATEFLVVEMEHRTGNWQKSSYYYFY